MSNALVKNFRKSVSAKGAIPSDFDPEDDIKSHTRYKNWFVTDDVVEWSYQIISNSMGKVAVRQDALATFFALRSLPTSSFIRLLEEFPTKSEIEHADLSVLFESDHYWETSIFNLISTLRDAGGSKSTKEIDDGSGHKEMYILMNPNTARSLDAHLMEIRNKCLNVNKTDKHFARQIERYGNLPGLKILHPSAKDSANLGEYFRKLGIEHNNRDSVDTFSEVNASEAED